ncbi:GGDEF domain-containing protein [Cellulosilyticum ruminicola]|uniref:GGDEF domain-containing protein n=1 Tax=Cellulosilyticum ruminicola TaxID=425254 RepID=UPI0006D12538|nr:GGDEF domain-containing protein [Cellulosilyticum ruminicola]
MLNEVGAYKQSSSYYEQPQQWYEHEAETINKGYFDYVVYKYEYISVYANYKLLCAQMAQVNGDIEVAINFYKETLTLNEMPFTKYTLNKLISLLSEYERYEEANEYKAELIKHYGQEATTLGQDYSDYALYKYEYNQNILKETKFKIRMYIYVIFVACLVLGGIIRFYLRNKKLVEVSRLDGLAKAYNRRYFEEYCNALKAGETAFAIIIFAIDYFKKINGTYGHLVGDYTIKQVVEISKQVILDQGKVFRYGGEEFVVIVENKTIEEVRQIAEAIRKSIEDYTWENEMHVTVSLGVKETTHDLRDIFNSADQNLYVAKSNRRKQVIDTRLVSAMHLASYIAINIGSVEGIFLFFWIVVEWA